jgi:superfamily II DNA or RNA helicase
VRFRFDAGTIVLEDTDANLWGHSLPGMQWDERVGALRAPAYLWPRIREVLVRDPGRVPDGVRPIGQILEGWSAIDLRAYQESAVLAWELSGRRGLVVLPTGSGKTMVALAAMARTGLSTLCLVPTRVLLEQWHKEIARVWSGPVGVLGDGVRRIERITVATIESAYRTMHRIGNQFDLLVLDEAHHFGGGVRDEALEMSTAGARLGLTATPPAQPAALERLRDLIGAVVFERAVSDLSGRFLAPFDLVTLRIALSGAERIAYQARMQQFRSVHAEFRRVAPGAPWEQFQREASRTSIGRQALQALKEARRIAGYTAGKRAAVADLVARHRNARVLLFTSDNESAYAIAREHLIMPMTCHIGRAEREEVLAAFRSGELRTLVSARVLNEGIDVPDAEVAIIVSGAMGEREHVQRVGRVLRPVEGKRATVYELIASGTSETAKSRRRSRALGGPPSDHRASP